jgi:hypothetical protein
MQANSKIEAAERVRGGFPQIQQQAKTESAPGQTKLVKRKPGTNKSLIVS